MQKKKRNTISLYKKFLLILAVTLLCATAAYLICSHMFVQRFQTNAVLQVGYNYLPAEYYDRIIDERPMNLIEELEDYIVSEETYALAGQYAGMEVEEIKNAVSVTNVPGDEYLIIHANADRAEKAHKMANGFASALDNALSTNLFQKEQPPATERTNIITYAPMPSTPLASRTVMITLSVAIVAATLAFVFVSKMPLFDALNMLFFLLIAIVIIFPFHYMFINTISDNALVEEAKLIFLPHGLHIGNYEQVFDSSLPQIANAIKISVLKTVLSAGLMTLVSAWGGYILSRKKLWNRLLWNRLLIVSLALDAGLISWYLNMDMLGMKNQFLAYILPALVAPWGILVVRFFVEGMPQTVEEAALVDGTNTWQYFVHIVLPALGPILVIIALFGAVESWNTVHDSLLLMQDAPALQTLQHRIFLEFGGQNPMQPVSETDAMMLTVQTGSRSIRFTMAFIGALPMLILCPFIRRHFEKQAKIFVVKK